MRGLLLTNSDHVTLHLGLGLQKLNGRVKNDSVIGNIHSLPSQLVDNFHVFAGDAGQTQADGKIHSEGNKASERC